MVTGNGHHPAAVAVCSPALARALKLLQTTRPKQQVSSRSLPSREGAVRMLELDGAEPPPRPAASGYILTVGSEANGMGFCDSRVEPRRVTSRL